MGENREIEINREGREGKRKIESEYREQDRGCENTKKGKREIRRERENKERERGRWRWKEEEGERANEEQIKKEARRSGRNTKIVGVYLRAFLQMACLFLQFLL